MDVDGVLAACGVEEQRDVVPGRGLRGRGSEDSEGILVFGIAAFGVCDRTFYLEVRNGLKTVVLREGDPEMAGFCSAVARDVDLIREGEVPLGFGHADSGVRNRCGVEPMHREIGNDQHRAEGEDEPGLGHDRNLPGYSIESIGEW
jgi:hypothetical protein